MLIIKQGFPVEDELVLCTVTAVHFHSVFVKVDEYDKTGLIHISEISPGRIRNIRDFVTEGKKIVCKVLKVDESKGHIDLSLRRVNESQKRNKINEIKKEQVAEKLVELAAKKLNLDQKGIYTQIYEKVQKHYSSVYSYFEGVANGSLSFKEIGLSKELDETLTGLIKDRIVPSEVKIGGQLTLISYDFNGVDIIRNALIEAENSSKEKVKIRYQGSGKYNVLVESSGYKEAEKILKKVVSAAIDSMKKTKGIAEFARQD